MENVCLNKNYFSCSAIENGALIHHDLHNALVAMKADVAAHPQQPQPQPQQQQQQTQHTNGTTASHSGSSGRSTPNNTDPAPGKLFVGGLSWQTSSEKLQEYFGVFGTVTDVLIMKDPVTQVSLHERESERDWSENFFFLNFRRAEKSRIRIHQFLGTK